MARRTHLTDVGLITFSDLADLGAGKREGWLSDPAILAAIHPRFLALAGPSIAFVLPWGSDDEFPNNSIRIVHSPSSDEGEFSAVEWVSVGDSVVLALGTSQGYLLVYSLENELILKQIVHTGRILRLRFREIEDDENGEIDGDVGGNSDGGDGVCSHELCVVMPGVIARFDGSDIKSFLERWYSERQAHRWGIGNKRNEEEEGNSFGKLPYRVWNVGKYGPCADAAITGLMPPPLLELQSEKRYFCAVTIGNDAVISAFRLSDHRSRSLVNAIISTVVPAAFSTITSFSKLIWRSSTPSDKKKPKEKPQPFARAVQLTCLKDHPRKGDKLTLSPSGTLAAITDSLGRILLLDTRALVVVRLWKGYRDAYCLFMEMLVDKEKGKSKLTSSYSSEYTKSHYCLCLAIHAPKKGIVEIWKMRTGPRVFAIKCPKGSKILQPSCRKTTSTDPSRYIPLEVFLLNGDSGNLSLLNRSIG